MSQTDAFFKSPTVHRAIAAVSCALMTLCLGGLIHTVSAISELRTADKVKDVRIDNIINTLIEIKSATTRTNDKLERLLEKANKEK